MSDWPTDCQQIHCWLLLISVDQLKSACPPLTNADLSLFQQISKWGFSWLRYFDLCNTTMTCASLSNTLLSFAFANRRNPAPSHWRALSSCWSRNWRWYLGPTAMSKMRSILAVIASSNVLPSCWWVPLSPSSSSSLPKSVPSALSSSPSPL